MAETNSSRKSYPRLPAKNWWDLRARFKQSIPTRVEPNYIQSVLGLTSEGAAQNLLGPLRALGLIDDENKPTDLAAEWRDDEAYPKVCASIRKRVYPQGLMDAFPGPDPDQAGVAKWISRETKVGDSAANGMALTYVLLTQADPSGQTVRPSAVKKPKAAAVKATTAAKTKAPVTKPDVAVEELRPGGGGRNGPSLHVDVQVHVPADATPELIDQIFASMAKHFGDQP